ncbi:MAG: hypothetical protein M3354_09165 [Chloroflexota bacterium]|nr:hypothetical protein [Chloroflexota bacterium]
MTANDNAATTTRIVERAAMAVSPRPSDEEAAALISAILATAAPDPEAATRNRFLSRWAMAGRRAALAGIAGGPASGWGTVNRRGAR